LPTDTAARGVVTVAILATVALSADAWLTRHGANQPAASLALAPLGSLRLLAAAGLGSVALYMASRARRDYRYLLVGLAILGGVMAMSAERPALLVVAVADCVIALLASSLWPESSHPKASRSGWALLALASAVTAGLFVFQHPQHRLASFLTLILLMAFAAAVTGLTLLDRNAPLPTRRDPNRARELYETHAGSAVHPFALIGGKRHFWSGRGDGFIAYGCSAGVALALGPALAEPEADARLYEDFRHACAARGWRLAFYQVSAGLADSLGWGHRYLLGSEAVLDLSRFSLEGPERARLRHGVSRGRRAGVSVELIDEVELLPELAAEVEALARQGSGRRRLGEMAFSVGRRRDACQVPRTLGLARDADGRLVAYTTWLWLPAGREVVLDEIQRVPDAPPGTVDLLMWTCLSQFSSSADQASLGLAPAAGSMLVERLARVERFLRRRLHVGGFAPGLYSFKAKFAPDWVPRYIVAERLTDWPSIWLAVFLLHYPDAIRRLRPQLRAGSAVARP
jgi:lysylphosphatidylglycerol synthetase-like protein (DUF2156 family)